MSYKVLLIDDKHTDASLEAIKRMAKMANIELVGEKYHVQGMEILKNDLGMEYQAVILDATGFKKSDVEEGKETNSGLYYSLKFLNELKSDRIIPWFVYTGAPRNIDDENFMEQISEYQSDIKFGSAELCYYTKTIHEKELLIDLKTEVDKLEQTKIEYLHKQVFKIAKNINIPNEEIRVLISIIKSIQSNGINLEPSLYFTQIRKYVEYVFRDAAKYCILHEKCIDKDGKINLTESSLFLAGENTKYLKVKCAKTHFPKIIAENLKNLIFVTGAASHTSDVDPAKNMDYQSYREQINTPYLLYQLLFTICDLFVWYDNYTHKNSEENRGLWINLEVNQNTSDWIDGYVTRIAENGWGTLQPEDGTSTLSIQPIMVTNNKINEGDKLKIRFELSPDGTKRHIKEIIKID